MNEDTTMAAEAVVPAKAAKTPRRAPGALNQNQIKSLDTATKVSVVAKKAPYHATLLTRGITEAQLTQLEEHLTGCRQEMAAAVASDTAQRVNTQKERTARVVLLASIREVQTAARQKFARSQPEALKDYYVGEKLAVMNRATLVQTTDGILQRLTDQSLPGITATTIATLQAQRDAYVQADTDQLTQVAASKLHREASLRGLKAATDLRIEVQYAADAAYPFDKPTSGPARTEFALPGTRRFTTP